MKCPLCNVDLRMTERSGVEIDYCPQCRGIWLDRRDLDEIIERSSEPSSGGRYDEDVDDDDFRPLRKNRDQRYGGERSEGGADSRTN